MSLKNLKDSGSNANAMPEQARVEINPKKDQPMVTGEYADSVMDSPKEIPWSPADTGGKKPFKLTQ